MKRCAIPVILAAFVLAGCQGGRYHHKVGNCVVKNGATKVKVQVWRQESVPDAQAKQVLLAACGAH